MEVCYRRLSCLEHVDHMSEGTLSPNGFLIKFPGDGRESCKKTVQADLIEPEITHKQNWVADRLAWRQLSDSVHIQLESGLDWHSSMIMMFTIWAWMMCRTQQASLAAA